MKTTLRKKIQSGFTIVNWLMVIVAVIAIVALLVVRQKASTAIYVGARLNSIGLEIQNKSLMARRYEKDFLLDVKTLGVEKSIQQNASKVKPVTDAIATLAQEGLRIAVEESDRQKLEAIPAFVETYRSGFNGVVAAIRRRGHVDTGAEGLFRQAAHQIEAQLKNSDKVEISLLILRRSEKDYLLRGEQQYLQKSIEDAKRLKQAIEGASYSQLAKEEANKSVSAYQDAFSVLVAADREVAGQMAVYNEAAHQLEYLSEKVAKGGLEQSERYLESASTSSWVAISLVLLASVIAIGLGVALASHISLKITRPVMDLTSLAERVSLGDLTVKIKHTSDDEIGELQEALGRLVCAVMYFQQESAEALAQAQAKVVE